MSQNRTAAVFGERLRALMRERGHVSSSSASGVDVTALAKVAGTTYEMARRYAEGSSVPREDKLRAIAAWLGVPPSALAWGEPEHGGGISEINAELLEKCLIAVEEAQVSLGIRLRPQKAASLVAVLYNEAIAGNTTSRSSIRQLVRAMAGSSLNSGPEPSSSS